MMNPTVLMYHGIGYHGANDCPKDPTSNILRITPEKFEDQLKFMVKNNIQGLSYSDWVNLNSMVSADGLTPIVLTFDDGEANNFTTALPLLEKYGMSATFYITTSNLNNPGWLNNFQVNELSRAGMEIGAHGHTHRFFSTLENGELYMELQQPKAILEVIIEESIKSVSLPGGRGLKEIENLAHELGYRSIATSKRHQITSKNVQLLSRWAISENISEDQFKQIIFQKGAYHYLSILKGLAGSTIKFLFGDMLYNKLWNRLKTTPEQSLST